jgi:tRNA uridine 5-carboxymethylaminomethyl modification enzyme
VLIDDLVTKGTTEPYRMMTSRAEYRLLLRQDNADLRLTQKGRDVGLVTDERYDAFTKKRDIIERTLANLSKINLAPSEENQEKITGLGSTALRSSINMLDLLRRPEVTYEKLADAFGLEKLPVDAAEQVDVQVKYQGYIRKQKQEVERALKLEDKLLPEDLDYSRIQELSSEAMEKLTKQRPVSIGQASRISGVSPADISVLMVYLETQRRKGEEA